MRLIYVKFLLSFVLLIQPSLAHASSLISSPIRIISQGVASGDALVIGAVTGSVGQVPEPSNLFLFALGIAGLIIGRQLVINHRGDGNGDGDED